MNVSYQEYIFRFKFAKEISINLNTISVIRSILGMNLKSMCCLSKNTDCHNCLYSGTCIYATFFESIISKNNTVLSGRNTASHPFVLSLFTNEKQSEILKLKLVLFGKYTEYLPYIYGAFVRAGKKGFGKERIPFEVSDITVDETSILETEEKLRTDYSLKKWELNDFNTEKTGEILIRIKTPLRYKAGGNYAHEINVQDFLNCLYRRSKTICGFYGNYDEEKDIFDTENCQLSVIEQSIKWSENNRYSSRQKAEMSLGGMTGDFKLQGKFRQQDRDLIEFARLFGAGKNTNFGLGQIDVWERME